MPNDKPTNKSSSPSAPDGIHDLLPGLPTPLALSLKDYIDEADPYKKLIRMCQCSEMLVRVLDAISFAVLYQAAPSAFPPERLKKALHGDLEGKCPISRPTFGEWLTMLVEAATEIRSMQPPAIPGLAEFAREVCCFVHPASTPPPNLCILDLRNTIAHTSRFSSPHATAFLETYGHAKKFEDFWRSKAASFFAVLQFWGVHANGRATLLHGPIESSPAITQLPNATSTTPLPTNSIVVANKDKTAFFDLTPMLFFAQVCNLAGRQLTPITSHEVTHAYARQSDPNEYEVMHPSIITGYATQAVQECFDRLFPVKAWRREAEERERRELEANQEKKVITEYLRPYAFRDIKASLLNELFVGRARQIDHILRWANETPEGCGLVLAPPGMGKTALAVRTGVEIARRFKRSLSLQFFFKLGDPRCSLRSFVHALLLHIQANGGPKSEMPNSDEELLALFEKTLQTFLISKLGGANSHDKLVVVLDGINEITQLCPRFPDLLLSWSFKNVVWLGFSQPTPVLQSALSRRPATLLFDPPGLPPLDIQDVRTLLMDELGPRVFEFLNAESSDGRSLFLEELSRRSGSLPLYLHCLVNDLRKGDFNFNQPHKLPASLEDFYSLWLTRADFDPSMALVPQIIALCAIALMPLTESMIARLLQDDPQSRDRDWGQLLAEGFKYAGRFLKPAYIWEGLNGLTVFHESFREYLLGREDEEYSRVPLSPAIRLAQKRLTDLCSRWREWQADSPERLYTLRYRIHHLVRQKLWPPLFDSLTDIEFLEEKLRALGIGDIVSDLKLAAINLPDSAQVAFLQELAKALQTNADFLTRHPTSFFQCAWGTMTPNPGQLTAHAGQSTARPGAAVPVLEKWRDHIEARGIPWLRTLHPPFVTHSETPVIHLGVGSPILRTVLSEDGNIIAGFAFPKLQKDSSLQPGYTFAWWKAGGTAMKWPWQQGKFAFPLGFGPKGEHLLLATETASEVWSIQQGFISRTLPAVGRRIVATVSAQGTSPFTLLTSDGTLYHWPGHGGEWETESLQLQDEVLCADLGAGGATWLLVTASGEVLSKASGAEVTRTQLPKQMTMPPKVFRDESGRIHADDDQGIPSVSYYGQKRTQVDLVIEPALGPHHTESFFKLYSALLSPVAVCSHTAQSVAILSSEKIDTTSSHEDEFYRGVLYIWSTHSPTEVRRITTPEQNCSAFALSPTGDTIAIGLTNGKVLLLHTNQPSQSFELSAHSIPITSLAFSPDGESLATSSEDAFIQPARIGGEQPQLHIGEPAASACSADGQYFASADQKRRIIIWDAQNGSPLHVHIPQQTRQGPITYSVGHEGAISRLSFISGSNKLVSVGEDNCFWVWDPSTGKAIDHGSTDSTMEVWPPTVHTAFSSDNSRLAFLDASGKLTVWDLEPKSVEVFAPSDVFEDVHAVALSPAGDVIAVCAGDHTHMIRLPSGHRLPRIKTPEALGISVPRWGFSAKDRDEMLAKLLAQVFPGNPKPSAKTTPYRACSSQTDLGTLIEDASTHQPIAWYPRPLRLIQMTPDGRSFLGFFGSTVHIVRLEL
jgi:WD40 repeat protein